MPTLRLNMTRQQFLKRLRDLPGTLTGRVPDNTGIATVVIMAGAVAMLTRLYHHSQTLTQGGFGDDGTRLKPLAPSTLILRRRNTTKAALRQMVTEIKKQGPTRRRLFLTQLKHARSVFSDDRQRRIALAILKKIGKPPVGNTTKTPTMTAKRYDELWKLLHIKPPKLKKHWTMRDPGDLARIKRYQRKLNVIAFAAAGALILWDTGRLVGAFSPAYEGGDQTREAKPGGFRLDNNVEYFKYHQSDEPRKINKETGEPTLPRRNLIPDAIPQVWIDVDTCEAMTDTLGQAELLARYFLGGYLMAKAKKRPQAPLTSVKTRKYRSVGGVGGIGGAMYWGSGGFGSSLNGFHLGYVERMRTDYQVSLCHDFLQAPVVCAQIALAGEPEEQKAQIVIKAQDPMCGAFIKRTMQRIWNFDLSHSLDDIGYGYAAGEGVYKVAKGLIEWDYTKPLSPMDVEPWTAEGVLDSVLLKPGGSSGMEGEITRLDTYQLDTPAKGLWFVNKPHMSIWFGRSDYYSAWHDWRVKSGMPDCVREIVFKATYKHAFSGMVAFYPEGSYQTEDGQTVNNRDDAEQMIEIAKTGTNFAISGARNGVNGERDWGIESYGKNEVDITRLIPIVEHHDTGIQRGMGIPDEIVTHDGNTGGYSRSRVAISAFFMSRQQVLNRKVEEWKRQVLEPLAKANFENSEFTIEVKSLLPEDPEQPEGQGGMGGMMPQQPPGLPGQPPGVGQPPGGFGEPGADQLSLAQAQETVRRFGKLFRHALKGAYESRTALSLPTNGHATRLSKDAAGHEHKGAGEGGGQFTSGGGGGQDDDQDDDEREDQRDEGGWPIPPMPNGYDDWKKIADFVDESAAKSMADKLLDINTDDPKYAKAVSWWASNHESNLPKNNKLKKRTELLRLMAALQEQTNGDLVKLNLKRRGERVDQFAKANNISDKSQISWNQIAGASAGMDLTHRDDHKKMWKKAWKAATGGNDRLSVDAQGHEHKGKGEGGGQFAKKGGADTTGVVDEEPTQENAKAATASKPLKGGYTSKAKIDYNEQMMELYLPEAGGDQKKARKAMEEDVQHDFGRLFPGKDVSHIASLLGAPDDAIVTVYANGDGTVSAEIESELFRATRTVGKDKQGRLYINNDNFSLNEDTPTGTGIGLDIFSNQVRAALDSGISYINADAAGTGSRLAAAGGKRGDYHTPVMNGFYSWPRMGFDVGLDSVTSESNYETDFTPSQMLKLKAEMKAKFPDAKTVLDILETEGGQQWWKQNGAGTNMKFDMSPGSRSLQVLQAYQEEKAKIKGSKKSTSAPTTSKPSTPPGQNLPNQPPADAGYEDFAKLYGEHAANMDDAMYQGHISHDVGKYVTDKMKTQNPAHAERWHQENPEDARRAATIARLEAKEKDYGSRIAQTAKEKHGQIKGHLEQFKKHGQAASGEEYQSRQPFIAEDGVEYPGDAVTQDKAGNYQVKVPEGSGPVKSPVTGGTYRPGQMMPIKRSAAFDKQAKANDARLYPGNADAVDVTPKAPATPALPAPAKPAKAAKPTAAEINPFTGKSAHRYKPKPEGWGTPVIPGREPRHIWNVATSTGYNRAKPLIDEARRLHADPSKTTREEVKALAEKIASTTGVDALYTLAAAVGIKGGGGPRAIAERVIEGLAGGEKFDLPDMETTKEQALQKKIVAAGGSNKDASDVTAAARSRRNEVNKRIDYVNDAIKYAFQILSNENWKKNPKDRAITPRHPIFNGGDHTSVSGFDTMADSINSHYPGIIGGKNETGGDVPAAETDQEKLWKLLAEGPQKRQTINDTFQQEMDDWEAERAKRKPVEEVPF